VAKIRGIHLVGNSVFSDDELLDTFKLSTRRRSASSPRTTSTRSSSWPATSRACAASTRTAATRFQHRLHPGGDHPDRQDITVTVNLTEGRRFTVSE